MSIILSILGIVFTICFVVGTHEYGHFITARLVGVKVLKFSIGFGKTLLRWRSKAGIEYVFALIPLGGYVQMLDENEVDVADSEKHLAYNRQPFYKKFLIVLAGPAVNLLCALVLYTAIFMMGFTSFKPIIGEITPNSIAAQAGLQSKQQIISVNNIETKSWMSVIFRVLSYAGDKGSLNVETSDINGANPKVQSLNLNNWVMDELTPDPLGSLGIKPYEPEIPLIIKTIAPDSPAAKSGLKIGDKIIAVQQMKIKNWNDFIETIKDHPGESLPFLIKRQHNYLSLSVKIGSKREMIFWKNGFLGIAPEINIPEEYLQHIQYGFTGSIAHAFREVKDFTYFNFVVLAKLFTGKLSLQSLGGPITIFSSAGAAIHNGIIPFISFLAFLSVAIGIINILPIPGLDGGHLLLETVQFVIRRPLPDKALLILYRLGVFIIIYVLIQAVVNDILRMY